METTFSNDGIQLKKSLNALDKFVIEFTSQLEKQKIRYVIISGYVAILFGRNRASEDIDIIIQKLDPGAFNQLWENLARTFECLNTDEREEAHSNYLMNGSAIRFSYKNKYIPNMEIKFPKTELDKWVLEHRMQVKVNEHTISISPIELQISFKLFLGSEKDIEDAKYLYEIFKDKLDNELLSEFNQKLKVEEKFKEII